MERASRGVGRQLRSGWNNLELARDAHTALWLQKLFIYYYIFPFKNNFEIFFL